MKTENIGRNPKSWNNGFKKGHSPTNTKSNSGSFKKGDNVGEKAHNWKEGISPLNRRLRASSMWKIWREAVFLRDNFTCQNIDCEFCNNKIGVLLHPHHINPFALFPELRFDISNGITYCAEFHLGSKLHINICKEVN